MNGTERAVDVKAWGYLGAKKGVLYEERGNLSLLMGSTIRK